MRMFPACFGGVLIFFELVLLVPMASRAQSISSLIELVPKITVNGPPGSLARVEWSENLDGPWNVWRNIVVEVAGTVLVDVSPGSTIRFYRAVDLPPYTPPSDEGFALIPEGTFEMGDSFNEGWDLELPVHTVFLSAFYMGRTEVTKAQWDEVQTWAMNNGYTDLINSGEGKGANHPVHSVSWFDVVKWCNAASERDGLTPVYRTDTDVYRTDQRIPTINHASNGYRLPTEAEWEKAARGGVLGQRFPWGNTISHADANYYSTSSYSHDIGPSRGYHPEYETGEMPYTSPVGSFAPNGYGLYDMAGNVWEWCYDGYFPGENSYFDSPSSDPRGPSSTTTNQRRVLRGGSWRNEAFGCRSAFRYYNCTACRIVVPSSSGINGSGFRLARSAVP